MAPGASKVGQSSGNAKTNQPLANPPKKATKKAPKADPDPKRLILGAQTGIGTSVNGGINGTILAIDKIGQFGDFLPTFLQVHLLHDLTQGKTFRLRAGGGLSFNNHKGDENTAGSNISSLNVSGILEGDWSRAYGSRVRGPSRASVDLGLGFGWGRTQAETISLHKQRGVNLMLGANLNLVNFDTGAGNWGLDLRYQTDATFGSNFNSPFHALMGSIVWRPSLGKKRVNVEVEKCDAVRDRISVKQAQIVKIREFNADKLKQLRALRDLFETGDKPLTVKHIRNALYLREVRLGVVKQVSTVDAKVLKANTIKAYKALNEGKSDQDVDKILLNGLKGVTAAHLTTAKQAAAKKYPKGYNFWDQITKDPDSTPVPKNIDLEDCDAVNYWVDRLDKERDDLIARKHDLIGRFDTALLIDALKDHLGEEVAKFVTIGKAMVLDINNPNFRVNFPTQKQVDALRSYVDRLDAQGKTASKAELLPYVDGHLRKNGTLSGRRSNGHRVFEVPTFELNTTEKVAKMMLGEEVPDTGTTTDPKKQTADEKKEEQALKDLMKSLTFLIEGHTSQEGSNDYNMSLSKRRAEFFMLMIRALGGPKDRLKSKGFGEERPLMEEGGLRGNALKTARIKNRRTVVRISGSVSPSAPTAEEAKGFKDPSDNKVNNSEVPESDLK